MEEERENEQKTIMEKQKSIYLVLFNVVSFLHERSSLTLGETEHIWRTIRGAKWTPDLQNHGSSQDKSPFYTTCQTIESGLSNLHKKVKLHKKTIESEKEEIKEVLNESIANQNKSIQYLEKIVLFDCLQQRSIFLAEKLSYFYRAYKNLVEKHGYIHIPLPDVSRRVKTSNLMLFFDQKLLKSGYEILEKHFFKIEQQVQERAFDPGIMSTWDFSASEHIKQLDDSNIYVSFSFWFFEKQYFYPIGYHELSHYLYYNSENQLRPSGKEKTKIRDFISKKVFLYPEAKDEHEAFFIAIYQDTIADIAAYAIAGESYIHALFYQGFLRDIHKNFYQDIEENAILKGEGVRDGERECIKRHENLSILSWQNISRDSISLFVRLKILLKMHRELSGEAASRELIGIKLIIDMVYSENLKNEGYPTGFEKITQINEKFYNEYRAERAQMLLVWALLDDLIFPQGKLKKDIKKRVEATSDESRRIRGGSEILEVPYIKSLIGSRDNKNEKWEARKGMVSTYFDFVWQNRFYLLEENLYLSNQNEKKIYSGRLWRAKNLYELGVLGKQDFEDKARFLGFDNVIHELILFKFKDIKRMPCPKEELESKDWFGSTKDPDIKLCSVSYACGPYNYAVLTKSSTQKVDKYLSELDKPMTESRKDKNFLYFTERHALLLLRKHEGNNKDDNLLSCVDFIVFITTNNPFSTGKVSNSISNTLEKLSEVFCQKNIKNDYKEINIYASMGNENLVVYIFGISPHKIDKIIDTIYEAGEYIDESYSMITFNKNILSSENNLFVETDMESLNADILLLCSVKNRQKVIQKIDKIIERALGDLGEIYRLFGVFDYKIRIDNNVQDVFNRIHRFIVAMQQSSIFNDVQIEFQPKVLSHSKQNILLPK